LVADPNSIVARWWNYFSQLLNVHGVSDVRHIQSSAFEIKLATKKLKHHKSPCIDQITAGIIKAGGRTIHNKIHKLIISVWNKKELPEEWKVSIIVPIHKKGDKTDCNK
jgi:hypothetical protein